MDQPAVSTNLGQLWFLTDTSQALISVNIVIILIATILVTLLWTLLKIFEPYNYELDLTQKKFCSTLAEIDNSLRFDRHANPRESYNKRNSAADCATDQNNQNDYKRCDDATSGRTHTANSNYVYPNGWIPLMESYKVGPGSVVKAIVMGRDVIVTRSAAGNQVDVLSAYCPHMGAHIGTSGRVRMINNESCVECPFHGWTFRASDGRCVFIPYQKSGPKRSIPKQAKIDTWTCVEIDNFIYIWHHIDNQQPTWFLTPSKQLLSDNWQLAGRSCHKTNLELRDMLENGADMNHFESIHNDLFLLGGKVSKLRPLKYLQQYFRHHWIPEWRPMLDETGKMTHRAEMDLQSWISLFKLRLFDITVHAEQIGPARVNLYYNSKWYGEGLLIMNSIPLGGRRTKYVQHIYTHRTPFQCFMAKWVLYGEIRMLERDFFIWNHKKNIKNPIFIPEDKKVKQFRIWYSQFYKRKRTVTIDGRPPMDELMRVDAPPFDF